MAWKRKRPSPPRRPYIAPVHIEPISVPRAVEDGMLIARSALLMATKNHLIVDTVRDGRAFDRTRIAGFVRAELRTLSEEQAEYATRMGETAAETTNADGASHHRHDYREADHPILLHRGLIYSALAEELAHMATDDAAVEGVIELARRAAWDEVSRTIELRLDRLREAVTDVDYDSKRRQRMKDLRKFDLVPLLRRR